MDRFSVCIVGAGVIGLAIAERLSRSRLINADEIVLLEQASSYGQMTSSRNSEVIHAGIYYPPNSLKAKFCIEGKARLYAFCDTYQIPYKRIGKCIVSKSDNQNSLEKIQQNAETNGVRDLMLWGKERITIEEPAVSATSALFSPSTGIVDSHEFMQSLYHLATNAGVLFSTNTRVLEISSTSSSFLIDTEILGGPKPESYKFASDMVINCAGLASQSVAKRIEGVIPSSIPQLHLCKGDYFNYSKPNPFNRLIYPVPEPNTIGLGIHSTQDLSGQLRFGPDTEYISDIKYDIDSGKSMLFAKAIHDYFPAIDPQHLRPAYSGIRPKLNGPGTPAADFQIQTVKEHGVENLIQLFGIESPGLTASLAIANFVLERMTGLSHCS